MEIAGTIIHFALYVFIGFLWVRFIVEWVQLFARSWSPHGFLLLVLELVYTVTDPPIKALRRVIPPLRLGSVSLDLSFIFVLIGAYLLLLLNDSVLGVV